MEPVTDWAAIRAAVEIDGRSLRAAARRFGVSHTTVNRHARAEGWAAPPRKPRAVAPPLATRPAASHKSARAPKRAAADDPTAIGRDLAARMLAELDAITTRHGELVAMIIAATADDDDSRRRDIFLRIVELPGRANILRTIGQAVRAFTEAAPGKKAAAADAAKEVGANRFATPAPPKLAVDNTK